mmetsp:Transcript_16669/g.30325  ORF Transcript_16669/g.30325 Transcript_16669/m.30325 type:complete len:113 (-) Transcript_16669:525-863(-)
MMMTRGTTASRRLITALGRPCGSSATTSHWYHSNRVRYFTAQNKKEQVTTTTTTTTTPTTPTGTKTMKRMRGFLGVNANTDPPDATFMAVAGVVCVAGFYAWFIDPPKRKYQ